MNLQPHRSPIVRHDPWSFPRLVSGYGWPFSVVLLGTLMLVVYAVTVFAVSLFTDMRVEPVSILDDFCYTHLQVSSRFDCTSPFPHSLPSNVSLTIDEANSRPPPIFSLNGTAPVQIKLLAPADLPEASFSSTKSCFLFKGEKGYIHVRTNSPMSNLTGIFFDYSFRRQLDPVYHPREVLVWGLHQDSQSSEGVEQHLRSLAMDTVSRRGQGNTSYILISRGFLNPIGDACMSLSFSELLRSTRFEAFVIQISSNWGGDHTCLAPFRFYVLNLERPI